MSEHDRLRQHELLTTLLRIARKQHAALQAERIDQFIVLTEERAAIMEVLEAVDGASVPANVVPFPSHAPSHDGPDVRAANGALLGTILRQDEENEILLSAQMQRLREAIGTLGQGYATARGYAAALPGEQAGHRVNVAG